ncbi:hypothetical protein [Amycolatopsis sp. NPDC051903]|uniref:hypothetical protein n=1 Tax=Amycolatopsis sp. NPDC051903 TaxID=3363936 RepID=UPI0037AE2907
MPDRQRHREDGFRTTWRAEQAEHETQQRQAERRQALDYERYDPPQHRQHLDHGPPLGL